MEFNKYCLGAVTIASIAAINITSMYFGFDGQITSTCIGFIGVIAGGLLGFNLGVNKGGSSGQEFPATNTIKQE